MKPLHLLLALFLALPALAELPEGVRGTVTGTVTGVDEATNQLQLQPDDDRYARINVLTDAVSTTFIGFGGVINGQPEIFIGSKGISNLREGDRIEVRGIGRGNHAVGADTITLLGRSVPASPTGVGDTRPPTTISTPTQTPPNSAVSYVQGIVQQVSDSDNRVVITTDRRELLTVRGTSATPVYYRNQTYHIGNLEVGDRIRIDVDPSGSGSGEIRARSIEVVQSVQDVGGNARGVSNVTGRVTSVDRANNTIRVDTGRGDTVRVDLGAATDGSGRRVRASDLQNGEQVDITGSFGPNGFVATTIRFGGGSETTLPEGTNAPGEIVTSTIYGTVVESLATSPQLVIKDAQGRAFRVYATDDFVVRKKDGSYTTAAHLKEKDNVTVKAYRDDAGNYIAQTIRVR